MEEEGSSSAGEDRPYDDEDYSSSQGDEGYSDEASDAPSTRSGAGSEAEQQQQQQQQQHQVSSEVEELTPATSRLASFTSGLRQRQFEQEVGDTYSSDEEEGAEDEEEEEQEQGENQSQDSHSHSNNYNQEEVGALLAKEEESHEEEAAAAEPSKFEKEQQEQAPEQGWNPEAEEEIKDAPPAIESKDEVKPGLNKELSTTWMKFEDEAWDSSKPQNQDLPPPKEEEQEEEEVDTSERENDHGKDLSENKGESDEKRSNSADRSGSTSSPPTVPNTTAPTSPRRINGTGTGSVSASADVAFWEDEAASDDEDAVDDAVIGKALETNSPRPPKKKKNAKAEKAQQQQQQQHQQQGPSDEKGWAGKMIGSALGFVTQKLQKNSNNNDPAMMVGEEDNVVEPADYEMPEFHNKPKNVEASGVMQDCSALSLDSDAGGYFPRRDANFERRARDNTVQEEEPITNNKPNESMTEFSDQFEQAVPNDKFKHVGGTTAAESRIKFAKEVNLSPTMPLFDLFMDLPHPAAAANSTVEPALLVGSPSEDEDDREVEDNIRTSMEQITSLAFPEYDGAISQASDEPTSGKLGGEKLMLEAPGFQHYTFTMKLESGTLVYAHVRRYLPTRDDAFFRYDVGRRSGRALIIISRFPGGDDFFAAILKTLDAMSVQHRVTLQYRTSRPQKWFLHTLYHKHNRMCGHYATNFDERRGAPHIITIQGVEFSDCMEQFATVDATHFFVPTCLLHKPMIPDMKTSFTCSILPLMRCLGVANTLRLLSALLTERRVVLVSVSPTRLDRSARAAMAMLAQGMLQWSHMCIPVLPPNLWSCLKSPNPYLIGVLAPLAYRLELTDRLGEVMVIDLDENNISAMGMTSAEMAKSIPDLCRSMSEAMLAKRRIAMPESLATEQDMKELAILNSTSDFLAQDLCEILKTDKQTMNGTAVTARHMARKATKAVKSTLKYFLGGKKSADDDDDEEQLYESVEVKKSRRERRKEPSAIFIEGCRNEAGEEAVQLAFVSFFLRMLGNSEGFLLTEEGTSEPPQFSKELFLKQRKDRGDGPGTPMWNMLLSFCETEMMKEFVKTREDYIRKRQPAPLDAPLFWRCIDYHVARDIDFGILHIRSVTRKMLQITSVQQMLPSNVRRLAMAITSKRKFEGNLGDATADLAELSRESSGALNDVMSVIWLRMRDCKGLQWVHGYQATRVLKEVLLHGPITVVSDATDGIDLIRVLAHRESKGYEQIQVEAREVYNLLVDRSRLLLRRRVAGEQRRIAYHDLDESEFHRDTRLNLKSPFTEMHNAMNPISRVQEGQRRRNSLSSRRTSLSSRLPHRLSISKHIQALEPMEDSMTGFPAVVPSLDSRTGRHKEFLHDTFHRPDAESTGGGSLTGELAVARRIVREYTRKIAEEEKKRAREVVSRRDTNTMGIELLRKQFMLLKVAFYLTPIFYFFGNHEHFLSIVMFLWLSQQFQIFRAPLDSGGYY